MNILQPERLLCVVKFLDVLEYFMGQPELMTPAEFVRMYEKPPQVTLDAMEVSLYICVATFHTVFMYIML